MTALSCPPLRSLLAGNPDFDPQSVSVAQARALLSAWVPSPGQPRVLPLYDALQHTLATHLIAPFDQPPHDCAAMDGYALRHADLRAGGKTVLPVAGHSLAGDAPGQLPPGHVWRIMTGAPLPTGADTVVMQEDTCAVPASSADTASSIRIATGQRAGQHVRRQGEDLQQGDVALPAGSPLGAVELGMAAALGLDHVTVWPALRVGVFSTGSELARHGQPLAPGQIHDSNRPALLALIRNQGSQPVDLGSVPDHPDALASTLLSAANRVDVLLSTGGAAGGDADLLQPVLNGQHPTTGHLGPDTEAQSWRLRLRPGRPLVVGRVRGVPLFGLPGNPVAALMSVLFVIDAALQKMAGRTPRPLPRIRAQAACAIPKRPGRLELPRVRLCYHTSDHQAVPQATLTSSQSSALLRSLVEADGIAILPEAQGPLAVGDWLDVVPLRGLLTAA